MKTLLRRLLAKFGLDLKHTTDDPVLQKLDLARNTLRLCTDNPSLWNFTLSQLALHSHLRDLIKLHAPDLVIDVGANRGQFALEIRELGYSGPMLSIEPQQSLADQLTEDAKTQEFPWEIIRGAASETESELILQTFRDDTFSSFHSPNQTALKRFGKLLEPGTPEKVPVRKLDDWLAASSFADSKKIFLKTDTQGHDLAVLAGAHQTLQSTIIGLAEGALIPLYDSVATPESLRNVFAPYELRPAGFYAVSHQVEDMAAIEMDCLFTRPSKP